jgi:CRISPR/Cas system CSM-associated protein Csm3 (group 7 of RAMP superfamily)
MKAQWQNSVQAVERISVVGKLVLETPTYLGNGDSEGLTDMPLLLDALDGRALLTGSTIAGALRSYLSVYTEGYATRQADSISRNAEISMSDLLFGMLIKNKSSIESHESYLKVHDSLGERPTTELRDGVSISPETRTALDQRKYDLELLPAGTQFRLEFELVLTEKYREMLLEAMAIALSGLERGEISIGGRKRRGYGRCLVDCWEVRRYRMDKPGHLLAWLGDGEGMKFSGSRIAQLLEVEPQSDRRGYFKLMATFRLDGSLLIRSVANSEDNPDVEHLKSLRKVMGHDQHVPVLSGTSLAGTLRARALRITRTVAPRKSDDLVDSLFGSRADQDRSDQLNASRLWVEEAVIQHPVDLVQSRIKIDRFTGGAYPGALFAEQPVFSGPDTLLDVNLTIQEPRDHEIGLLLLLLKDLWLGDLPLGGEVSVGRGRLRGISATLILNSSAEPDGVVAGPNGGDCLREWTIKEADSALEVSSSNPGIDAWDDLERYVRVLWEVGQDVAI